MVEKVGVYVSAVFCQRKLSLFWWKIVFKNFVQRLGGCFLDFGKKISTDCQKCIFICPENHLQEKVFPEKKKPFVKFLDIERSFPWNFWWKKWIFVREVSAQLSRLNSRLPEGHFGEQYVSRKKINSKKVLYFERSFSFLLSNLFCLFIKNASLFADERFETNHFFEQKFLYEFFQKLRGKLTYSCNESSTDWQNCVSSV